jgi:transglutaminase-like putative cysteine protease
MQRAYLVIVLTSVFGCAHWEQLPPDARPSPDAYPNAAAVVLADELEAHFHEGPSGKPVVDETQYVRACILREGGEAVARVRIEYDPELSTVESFSARTIAPDGSERHFGKSDLTDLPAIPDHELYSDGRALTLQLQPLLPGTIVEYRYTRREHDLGMTKPAQSFDGTWPTARAQLTARAPSGWQLAWTAYRQNQQIALPPTVSSAAGETRMEWTLRDLPALPSEPFAAEPSELTTRVGLRLVRWSQGGREARAPVDAAGLSAFLYRVTLPPEPGRRPAELARGLVKDDPPDPTVRARRLYNWVRDHISYCAIEIGMGGWRPHAAGEVERLHYGDCKDKANLLHEMLAAVDIPSYLVILFAHDGMPLPFDPIGWLTNHAILAIQLPGGDLLVDPTSRTTPFGALPASDQEADYLPMLGAGQAARRAPASRAEDNTRELELDLAPSGDDLTGSFRSTVQGDDADRLRTRLIMLPRAEQDQPVADMVRTLRRHLVAWHVENGDPPVEAAPVELKGLITMKRSWPSTRLHIVALTGLVGSSVPSLPRGPRQGPLVFRVRRHEADVVRLALDDAATVSLPPPALLERPFGRYELRWSREPGKLVASRTLELREHVFSAARYGEVKQFFDDILAAEARAVTIRKEAP